MHYARTIRRVVQGDLRDVRRLDVRRLRLSAGQERRGLLRFPVLPGVVDMTEVELEREVRRLITVYRLQATAFHVPDSRRMQRGLPDWIIIGHRVLWRELKSAYGAVSREQRHVGYVLQAAGEDWAVWRPVDLASGRIERELESVAEL